MKKGAQTKENILCEARKLLIVKGFHNTSISDIINATGVKKGNLYYHFASKEDLGLAVLEDAKEEFCKILDESFEGNTPFEKIIKSIETIFDLMKKANLAGGCLFGNTALEMTDNNKSFADIIQSVFDCWVDKLEDFIVQGQKDSSVSNTSDSHLLAKLIVSSIEGAIMMARVSKDEKDLDDCLLILQQILSE